MAPRVLIEAGKVRVSKPGVDVTATSLLRPDELLLSEGTQSLGILMTGQATATRYAEDGNPSYNGAQIMLPYDLGYVPFVLSQRVFLADEAINTPAFSEINRIDVATADYGYYLYPMTDRLLYFKWGGTTTDDVVFRYVVYYVKGG